MGVPATAVSQVRFLLKEIMDRTIDDLKLPRAVQSCPKETLVQDVVKQFQDTNVGSVVITEGKKVFGIFTERDYLKKIAFKNLDPKGKSISEFMTVNPTCIKRHETLGNAITTMRKGKFRHLVVTDGYGNVEQVISMRDVMDFVVDTLQGVHRN